VGVRSIVPPTRIARQHAILKENSMPKNKSDLMLTSICKIRKQSIDLTPATWSGNRGSGPRFAFCVVMAGDVLYRHRSTSLTLDRIGSFRLRPAFVVPLSTLAHTQTMRASPATRSPILFHLIPINFHGCFTFSCLDIQGEIVCRGGNVKRRRAAAHRVAQFRRDMAGININPAAGGQLPSGSRRP